MTIRTARFAGPRKIELCARELMAPGPGEVTLRVSACGICGTDLHFYSGHWPQPAAAPGHEVVGNITALGPGVSGWSLGDRVVVEPVLGCGACRFCVRGEANRCAGFRFIGVDLDGGLAEAVRIPVSAIHRVPDHVSDVAAALTEPLAVGVHACRSARVGAGDTVLICGGGTIGLLAIAAARDAGAGTIICSARYPHQQAAATRLGARPIAPEALDATLKAESAEIDVALETVGGPGQAAAQAMSAVRPGGVVALVGGFTRPTSMHLARVVNREIGLIGCYCYNRSQTPTDFETALAMVASGRFDLEALVTHEFQLEAIANAFAAAESRDAGAIKTQIRAD